MSTEKEELPNWPDKPESEKRGRHEPELSNYEKAIQRCGKGRDYDHCTKAGSEYCDWECPFNS